MGAMGESRQGEGTRKRLKITVAHFDNSDLIKSCSRIVVGRCMNPPDQEMKALLNNLPKIWGLVDRVTVKNLGLGKFQFEFEREEDIEGVLKLQPYHFDYWMVALAKWQPKRSINYPSEIPFWVRVLGVSKEFRTVPTFESIGGAIGKVVDVDLDLMRVLVIVDAFKELCFETSVDFTGGEFYDGEEVPILLRYEKLFGYCETCGSLCHHEAKCPLTKGFKQHSEKKSEVREGNVGNGSWNEGNKYDDRARSYKGVVMNGNGTQQHRERDTREYHGKGKGKMFEEDAKWVRVADRNNKRSSGPKGTNRGDGEEARHKSLRRDENRRTDQGGDKKEVSGQRGAQQKHLWSQEDTQEEGEIRNDENGNMARPSPGFQEQLAMTQAAGNELVSDPTDAVNGLKQLQGLVEGQLKIGEDEVMEWEDLEAADDLPELTAEEVAAINAELEAQAELDDTEAPPVNEEEKKQQTEEENVKQATKKRLFKSTLSSAASTKMRTAKGIASPRKKAPVKTGPRLGDNRYQQEIKVASNLMNVHQKP